ncbi:MAG: SsrA-binding protein SmpB [Gammaproteobacteria bacterium]|nr:SsrA-binding protein SmpB [Gammaproteobacteria bacterium]
MAKAKGKQKTGGGTIVVNRKARHDYAIEERIEAGVELLGWEVKALRAGKGQIVDSFVMLRDGEAFLQGAHIAPLPSASSHVVADPARMRKLLLHRREIARIFSATQQKGYTCIATGLYWKDRYVKCEVALAKGKKQYDKRAQKRDEDWNLEKRRLLKHSA